MGQAFYRKYRSKKLSEVVGQEHITKTLSNALKLGKISHAYLFTGPHGVGKTSVARILAHEINNLPYTDDSTHLDIIEIDAASNRRIDEIRDLREKVHIAPSSAKYKVYIIDEVHMLTKESFNALLKTLEEPPAHVVFILATTEAHKLPETIISRTQRFTFKSIEPEEAIKHLAMIADKEGIKIDKPALKLLVEHGHGSFRDTIGLLDQIANYSTEVTKKDIGQILGLAPNEAIEELLQAVAKGSYSEIVDSLENLTEIGITPAQTAKQLANIARTKIISSDSSNEEFYTGLLEDLLEVPSSHDPASKLEILLFKNCVKGRSQKAVTPVPNDVSEAPQETLAADEPSQKQDIEHELPRPVVKKNKSDTSNWWPEVLSKIKGHNNTLYGVLRMAEPELGESEITLRFAFPFHAKKIASEDSLSKLLPIVVDALGREVSIKPVYAKELKNTPPREVGLVSGLEVEQTDISEDNNLKNITSIFGGGEVIEDQ